MSTRSGPLRIALVVERLEPRGGVEAVAWAVATGLARAGEEVDVLARACPPGPPAGVRVVRLRVPSAWQPLRVLAFSRAAARHVARADYDVVQSFSRTRRQHVYRAGGGCHAAYMERAYGRIGARLRRASPRHAVLLAIEEAVLRDPTQVILCNSEMVRTELATRYAIAAERLHVIVNGVDAQRFSPDHRAARREPVRAMLGAGDATAWLLVGSGFERKGVATAIRALARLDDPRTELWIAGAGDPRPYLQQAERLRVRDRVRFVGQRDDLPDLYAAADGFVLPTRYDACANACLEAAASGLPVVTSASNGAAGWLGTAGVTIGDAEDVAGFAAALERLAEPGARHALGRAARARAERASWQQHVSALRALYRQLMAAR